MLEQDLLNADELAKLAFAELISHAEGQEPVLRTLQSKNLKTKGKNRAKTFVSLLDVPVPASMRLEKALQAKKTVTDSEIKLVLSQISKEMKGIAVNLSRQDRALTSMERKLNKWKS